MVITRSWVFSSRPEKGKEKPPVELVSAGAPTVLKPAT
jgi:hypothetical protein